MGKKPLKAVPPELSILERLEGQTTLSILNTGLLCGHAIAIGQVMEYLKKTTELLVGHRDLEAYISTLKKVIEVLKYDNEQITQKMFLNPDHMLEAIEKVESYLAQRKDGKFITTH